MTKVRKVAAVASSIGCGLSRFLQQPFYANKHLKIACVFLYADVRRYAEAHREIERVLSVFGEDAVLIKVNNWAEQEPLVQHSKTLYTIGGDNSAWEFSGWAKGLRVLEQQGISYDLVLFVNDAYLNYSLHGLDARYYSNMINRLSIDLCRDSAIGHLDALKVKSTIHGLDCSWWLKTNFFAVPARALKQMNLVSVTVADLIQFCPEQWTGQLFQPDAPISKELAEFLEWWMTQGWTRSAAVSAENWPFVRRKIMAILNERLFSLQLRTLGVKVLAADKPSLREGRMLFRPVA